MTSLFLSDNDATLQDLFHTFSSTSTLHGMSFLGTTRNWFSKVIWIFIVLGGLVLSIIGIDQCVKGWESNPVITSVWQVPIESIPFPSVTICPIVDKR